MTIEIDSHTGAVMAVDADVDPGSPGGELAHGVSEEVDEIAVAVRGRLNRIRQEIVAIGRDLHRAKALLKRGQRLPRAAKLGGSRPGFIAGSDQNVRQSYDVLSLFVAPAQRRSISRRV